jgi:hypothetical protein
MRVPDKQEFHQGVTEFGEREERDAMYNVATFLLEEYWGSPSDMADGLGVLLLTWNQAFYRTQSFDFGELEECIRVHLDQLSEYRERSIASLSESDESEVEQVFVDFLDATRLQSGYREGYRSPVGVAKGLHLLAPDFFPLWDRAIAQEYGYSTTSKSNPEDYIKFCWDMKEFVSQIGEYDLTEDEPVLKLVDEYNYSKYTQGWI